MKSGIVLLFLCALGGFAPAQKPDVWIITDMSDKTLPGKNKEGTINDPDDISTLAAYLLMANHFNTKGIVVASTHRMEHRSTPNQAEWAKRIWETAYAADLPHLNRNIGGYPDSIPFLQSAIKESGEKYDPTRKYIDLSGYPSIKALMDAVLSQEEPLYILCWGSLTEPAIFVNHCLNTRRPDLLKRVRFIGHWTNSGLHQGTPEEPWKVANCNEDLKACEYIKSQAKARQITYYECGAIGQHGIVSGGHFGKAYFERFRKSKLGTLFAEGKFVFNGVDFSDAATFWVLLGNWGVSLADLSPNGVNTMELEKRNEQTFQEWSRQIHDELLNRALSAQPAPKSFRNPVIPGFHPDPSICRVGEDYYLVNSSFEFFPGLPIFHSTDLVHWNLIGYGITRPDQVPLPVGLPDSRGIYAPAIRYKDGTFYVVTTCVNCNGNFYITAKDPAGPWSDPQWLPKASGIDPTLFWDSDGKCYYVGHGKINGPKEWPNQEGVWIQELDLKTNTLLGEKKQITHGHASNARWTEGPHLYKIDGKYLLVAAEGGTGFHHAVTVFHSDSIYGPYIPDHSNPVLTHRNLGQGYPDFACDPELVRAVSDAMARGLNQYPPMTGVPVL
nr:family 43 glycosylhydrolase [Haliscomenobacter sp.]